jgi:hypothetical protein
MLADDGRCLQAGVADLLGERRGERGASGLKSVLILDPGRFQHIVQNNQLVGYLVALALDFGGGVGAGFSPV